MNSETARLIKLAQSGDKKAMDAVVTANLGLVRSVVRHFTASGSEYDDLYQVGCMGLVRAVMGFDLSRGLLLSTYAVPAITGEIKRYLRDNTAVKVSRSLKERASRVAREREAFISIHGREPALDELASALGLSVEDVVEAAESSAAVLSLDVSYDDGEGNESELSDCLGKEDDTTGFELRQAILRLDAADRRLIGLRYFCDLTQQQTAEKLRMTQVQVSRREKKIIEMLRSEMGAP